MSCGPWCVYYRDRAKLAIGGICSTCSNHTDHKARSSLGKVDPFRLAKLLKEKKEKERRNKILKLSDCPHCLKHSLFYNSTDDCFECFNLECSIHSKSIKAGTKEYQTVLSKLG